MIVSLNFTNFKSYRDTAEFSFEALDDEFNADSVTTVKLKDGSSIRLLNSAVIFGANASGKSNVIKALDTLSITVQGSLLYTIDNQPLFIFPYAFDKKYIEIPTSIELKFIFDGRLYQYRVEGVHEKIVTESLQVRDKEAWCMIFDRKEDAKINPGEAWPVEKSVVDDSNLLTNQLVLSWIATKSMNGLQELAKYIANLNMLIYWGSLHSGMTKIDRRNVLENIIKDTNSKIYKRLGYLLSIADLGVTKIMAKRYTDKEFIFPASMDPESKKNFISQNRWDIRLGHLTSNPEEVCLLNFDDESDGTQALFGVGARLLEALDKGAFVAYDEINDAIHPAILRFLVGLFQSKVSNPKGAQLLFSTHDSSVADHNTLRADQVWFAEKKNSVSELFSAQDFEDVGIQVPFENWYRAGRFGALPSIGDFEEIFRD